MSQIFQPFIPDMTETSLLMHINFHMCFFHLDVGKYFAPTAGSFSLWLFGCHLAHVLALHHWISSFFCYIWAIHM